MIPIDPDTPQLIGSDQNDPLPSPSLVQSVAASLLDAFKEEESIGGFIWRITEIVVCSVIRTVVRIAAYFFSNGEASGSPRRRILPTSSTESTEVSKLLQDTDYTELSDFAIAVNRLRLSHRENVSVFYVCLMLYHLKPKEHADAESGFLEWLNEEVICRNIDAQANSIRLSASFTGNTSSNSLKAITDQFNHRGFYDKKANCQDTKCQGTTSTCKMNINRFDKASETELLAYYVFALQTDNTWLKEEIEKLGKIDALIKKEPSMEDSVSKGFEHVANYKSYDEIFSILEQRFNDQQF